MKKVSLFFTVLCLWLMFGTSNMSAQVPNGTYIPCTDMAKNMYIEKVVFNNANKVTIYIGTMGMTMGFEEFNYEVQEINKKLPFVQVYFEYDKTNDILVFGEAYANSTLGLLSQMGNSVKLMYNKSGNCNPNLISNSKIRILVKDNNQDVSAEIINNYLLEPDNNTIIPRLDKASAIKSSKYTEAQIATATKILHDAIYNYFRGMQKKIDAANIILSTIGDNAVEIVNAISGIRSLFKKPVSKTMDVVKFVGDPIQFVGEKVADKLIDGIKKQFPSLEDFLGQEISNDIKPATNFLNEISEGIKFLIDENDRINK